MCFQGELPHTCCQRPQYTGLQTIAHRATLQLHDAASVSEVCNCGGAQQQLGLEGAVSL